MAGVISVGGLASGLDTNSIVDQLVALERRPITLLEQQIGTVQKTRTSFATLESKLGALRTAADRLNTVGEVLAGVASSSDERVVTAAAGTGASRGTLTLTVSQLAQGSVASATTGVAATTDAVATGPGTFSFQVGAGAVRSVDLTAGTTLDGLVSAINDLGAFGTAFPRHSYRAPGAYTVAVTVTDDHGGVGSAGRPGITPRSWSVDAACLTALPASFWPSRTAYSPIILAIVSPPRLRCRRDSVRTI